MMKKYGLDKVHKDILSLICEKPYYDYSKIRRTLGIKSSSTVPAKVKQLEVMGLVSIRERGQGKSVFITPVFFNKKRHIDVLTKLSKFRDGMPIKEYYGLLGDCLRDKNGFQNANYLDTLKQGNLVEVRISLSDAGKSELKKLRREIKLKDTIKMMKGKGMNSNIKNTPPRLVKMVLRPHRDLNHFDEFCGCDLYVPLYNLLLKKKQQEII